MVLLKVPNVKVASEKLKDSLKKAAGVDVVFGINGTTGGNIYTYICTVAGSSSC